MQNVRMFDMFDIIEEREKLLDQFIKATAHLSREHAMAIMSGYISMDVLRTMAKFHKAKTDDENKRMNRV